MCWSAAGGTPTLFAYGPGFRSWSGISLMARDRYPSGMEPPPAEPAAPEPRRRRRFGPIGILVAVALAILVVVTLIVAVRETRRRVNSRTKCPNNLRQLAFAAIQYS